ncbi:LacI family DNA-binding transcriptional regulator [Pengzhenrongella sicca]|uniref:LacI family DNA-binding transcriptional regulator n=1 Tax=Pengzhenrongella sicca TaxID=2819238 RepID=A0A8A4ZA68_9MICO|nr:LacI family DNA-binding transcriptional regulator [Pengzhenrongella sicca]QTE28321.1 LacI family DNA-binding transcriptional regulator [Pengzhenrongella sicca]
MNDVHRPTLETVAARAAVSRQTVSNALNAPHLVRPETLARVLAVVGELEYRPHGAARQLRTNRSHVIGLRLEPTVDGISGALLDRFLHALTEQAQQRGYRVMLFTAADDDAEIAQYGELLDVLQVDAFVLTSTHHDDPRTQWLSTHGVPFVTFGRAWASGDAAPPVQHAWVDVDGAAGTQAAVEHLVERGHRRIAFIGWPDGSDSGDDRRAGWHRAMIAADVAAPRSLDGLCARVVDGVGSGSAAAEELLASAEPTAFVCASDSLALGALVTARAHGRATPSGEVTAVVGFDDTPVARAIGLTSVAQPLIDAAERAFGLLLSEVHGNRPRSAGGWAGHQVLLQPELVPRESSARPAPRGPD